MNWLDFNAAIIGHIAWPLTIVWIAFLLRKPIIELIPGLERLKFKEFELEFKKRIQEALPKRKLVTAINEVQNLDAGANPSLLKPRDYYADLVGISPRAAILESWMEVEAAGIDAYAKVVSPGMKVFVNPREILRFLCARNLLNDDDFAQSEELRKLRNKAAHQVSLHEMDETVVQEFVTLSLDLAAKIRGLVV